MQLRLLAKIWYTAQILPPLLAHTQKLTIFNWYIWQGTTFRVPATTLQQLKEGGWALPDHRKMQDTTPEALMDAKCTRRISDSGVDVEVDTSQHPGKTPAWNQDTKENGVSQTLHHRHGTHTPTGKIRISDNIQETNVRNTICNDHC